MGDTVMVTDNKYLVEAYKKNVSEYIVVRSNIIKRFLVSTDFTPKSGIKRKYTPTDLCDVDIKCSQNKIGEIINLAQMLNSLYWDWKYKGVEEHVLLELYKDISALNILSCIEIDRCKKLSPVDAKKELNKIREKYNLGKGTIVRDKVKKEVNIRPYFFKFLDGGKDYKFDKFNTGMDYLEEIVDETIKRNLNYNRTVKLVDLMETQPSCKASRKTVDKVKKYYLEMRDRINYIYYMNYDNKYEMVLEVKQETLDKLNKLKINSDVIYTILKRMAMYELGDKRYNEYRGYGLRCLTLLYDYNKRMFFSCFKVRSKKNEYIVPCKDGEVADLVIHGVGFKRVIK